MIFRTLQRLIGKEAELEHIEKVEKKTKQAVKEADKLIARLKEIEELLIVRKKYRA